MYVALEKIGPRMVSGDRGGCNWGTVSAGQKGLEQEGESDRPSTVWGSPSVASFGHKNTYIQVYIEV